MNQIRPNQIIPSKESEQNPFAALPRDLDKKLKEILGGNLVSDLPNTGSTQSNQVTEAGSPNVNYGESQGDSALPPQTPAILGIKEQVINMNDDGTATIDVILNVQDINGVTEYDIRIAKDNGNL